MKVKLFIGDKGILTRFPAFQEALEAKINSWLAANAGIKIHHIVQSSNGGSFDTTKVVLSIWYEEGAESGSTHFFAIPDGETAGRR